MVLRLGKVVISGYVSFEVRYEHMSDIILQSCVPRAPCVWPGEMASHLFLNI